MTIDYREIDEFIDDSNNIFDIYIYIYSFLKRNLSDLQSAKEQEYDEEIIWTSQLNGLEDKDDFNIMISDDHKDILKKLIPRDDKYKALTFMNMIFTMVDGIAGNKDFLTSKNNVQDNVESRVELNCLNTEATFDKGMVIYKEESFLEKIIEDKDRFASSKQIGETIESYQNNLLVKDKLNIDTKVTFYKITDRYILNKLRDKQGKFNIVSVPFTADANVIDIEKLDYPDGIHFKINGINREDEYIETLQSILEKLSEQDTDIVILPEMIFTEAMVDKTIDFVRQNRNKFLMIVCGTVWSERKNKCVLIGGNGKKIGEQLKLNRYKGEVGIEDIKLSSKSKNINIYDLKGFGRFCTPICVDFITDDYFNSIANSGVNICLVPTYTASLTRFRQNAEDLGNKNFGSVFLANCCAATTNKEISFSYMPRRKDSIHSHICDEEMKNGCKDNPCQKYFVN